MSLRVDIARSVVKFEFQDEVRAEVLNVRPAVRAGAIAEYALA